MEREEHRKKALGLIGNAEDTFPEEKKRELSEACYTFSELSLWGADMELDSETALRIWAVVESVRRSGFPTELRM